MSLRASAFFCALCVAALAGCDGGQRAATSPSPGASASSTFPGAGDLIAAASDDDDWILPAKSYAANRYTGLAQITPQNVSTLAKAWTTELADNGQQESSLLVWHGIMYVSTPHDNVIALDAATGKLKWQFPYNPTYSLVYTVNRGVGLEDGKIFIATLDCHVIAIDALTGKQAWNVNGCPTTPYASTANSLFSMAAYVYRDVVILGTGGGDDGNIGHVMAFSTHDGHRVWDWQNIPGPGQPGHETWPGDSWKHGAGDTWAGLSVDPTTQTLFIPVGNPGPDMVDTFRKGRNLYTDSVVALDISGPAPKLRWYYQMTQDDTHDADPDMPPVLFDAKVGSTTRALLAEGDKAGNFVVLDRRSGKLVYRMAVDRQTGVLTTHPTVQGTFACPNHGGGIEWNGGGYDPATNRFLVPSTQECATWKLATTNPQYIAGQPYTGGPLPKRQRATGVLDAIDLGTGRIAWAAPLPYSAQGGVAITRSGLVFTSDTGGDVYAIAPQSGKVLWHANTGASIIAPLSVYAAGGNEYVAVLSGSAGSQQTPNAPVAKRSLITAYRLGPVAAIVNSSAGQQVVAETSAQNAAAPASVGTAPYTASQAAAGAKLYGQQCSSCHGAHLQGLSAPALSGVSFGNAHLTLASVRNIVIKQMPLSAPGSLTPQQYASIMAYLLQYDCVRATPGGSAQFPTVDQPGFAKVTFGGRSCPPTGQGAF
jgi:alcohol dehydrogenase (cytochrome c)